MEIELMNAVAHNGGSLDGAFWCRRRLELSYLCIHSKK